MCLSHWEGGWVTFGGAQQGAGPRAVCHSPPPRGYARAAMPRGGRLSHSRVWPRGMQPKRPRSEGVAIDGLRSSRALACSRVHRAAIALLDQLPPRLVALGEASRYPRLRVECRPQVTRRAPAGARSAPLLGPPRDGTCRLATVRHSLNAPSSNPLSGTRAAA